MRRACFFIVAIAFATTSFASIPRVSILDDAPAIDTPSAETRVWASDVLAPFDQPAEGELTRALRQAYEQVGTTNASGLGRFLPVDPYLDLQKATRNPQNWNRYSYVRNNPMNLVDPDGRDDVNTGSDFRVAGAPSPKKNKEFLKTFAEASGGLVAPGVATFVLDADSVGDGELPKGPTKPTLPNKTLATDGKVEIYHNCKSVDHGHAHAHVRGGGPDTRIGPNGKPAFKGDAPMTRAQQKVYDANKSKVRRAINKIGRWLASQAV